MTCALFCSSVCGIFTSGKLLRSPKEAVADPLPNYLLFGGQILVGKFPAQLLPSPLKDGVADSTLVQSKIATRYGMHKFGVLDGYCHCWLQDKACAEYIMTYKNEP